MTISILRSATARSLVVALGVAAAAAGVAVAPALADPYDAHHGAAEWRGHEAREHAWRDHERRERYAYAAPAPRYYYAPPAAVAPPSALNFVFPLNIR
jgi:hypothetical protein